MTNKTSSHGFGTRAIHAGVSADPSTGAIMTPIFQTSTYVQSAPGVNKGYDYSRAGNPTRSALERSIAQLEGAQYGLAFASGMAATDTVCRLLEPGDEVVAIQSLYGGVYRMLKQIYHRMGVKSHFVPMDDLNELETHLSTSTRLVWIETPTNPTLDVIDIEAVASIAKKYGARVGVDNTFASPYLQQPLALGADLVMHSATKYLGGHSDLILGALVTNNKELAEQLYFIQKSVGNMAAPQDCFLTLRGIKTLHVRMSRHCDNAMTLAEHLSQHPAVAQVCYPGLDTHPQHAICRKQMKAGGGMLSCYFKDPAKVQQLIQRVQVFALAESLGGVESLISLPHAMTHASMPEDIRKRIGINELLVRLSVGIEDIDDLIQDIDQALA